MAKITAAMIQEIRRATGAGMLDCKKALQETDGDMDKAKEYLRKKGLAAAAKKSGRIAAEGRVQSYIHGEGKIGVLIEVNCETDFAAKTKDFKDFVDEIALHIAAAPTPPLFVKREEVPAEMMEKEREIYIAQLKEQGKPEKIMDKIVEGKINKWYSSICLMEQGYAFDEKISIDSMVKDAIAKIGENITIRRFARYELGEGLEKREYDLAKEVAAEINK